MEHPYEMIFQFDRGTVKYTRRDDTASWKVDLIHQDDENLSKSLPLPHDHIPNVPNAVQLYTDWLASSAATRR